VGHHPWCGRLTRVDLSNEHAIHFLTAHEREVCRPEQIASARHADSGSATAWDLLCHHTVLELPKSRNPDSGRIRARRVGH